MKSNSKEFLQEEENIKYNLSYIEFLLSFVKRQESLTFSLIPLSHFILLPFWRFSQRIRKYLNPSAQILRNKNIFLYYQKNLNQFAVHKYIKTKQISCLNAKVLFSAQGFSGIFLGHLIKTNYFNSLIITPGTTDNLLKSEICFVLKQLTKGW